MSDGVTGITKRSAPSPRVSCVIRDSAVSPWLVVAILLPMRHSALGTGQAWKGTTNGTRVTDSGGKPCTVRIWALSGGERMGGGGMKEARKAERCSEFGSQRNRIHQSSFQGRSALSPCSREQRMTNEFATFAAESGGGFPVREEMSAPLWSFRQ